MIRLLATILSLLLILTDAAFASPLSRASSPAIGSAGASTRSDSALLAQSRGTYRAPSYQPNYNYQRQLQQQQQQQMQQQQMQRQRMEQQRQQQALQRQRMQEQQRQQQQAMRQRQLQMQAQRQRMTEQRRFTQTRQREEIQRRQAGQSQALQNRAVETRRLANAQRLRIDQQRKIREFRSQRETREKLERQQQKANVPLAAGLAATGGLTTAKSQQLSARLENTRKSLSAAEAEKYNLKGGGDASSRLAGESAKVAALKNFKNCAGGVCKTGGLCSFHGDMRVKTDRGLVPIRDIRVGQDRVWSRDEATGIEDWKPVLAHYDNIYDETVRVRVRDGATRLEQTIISNRIHPFYVSERAASAVAAALLPVGMRAPLSLGSPESELSASWVAAEDLKPGDVLVQPGAQTAEVVDIHTKNTPLRAYNITVGLFHTYFVSGSTPNGVPISLWVHNDCNEVKPGDPKSVLLYIRSKGVPPKGYKGGRKFDNDGRGGGQKLPTYDSSGNRINYREYDINPYAKGERGINRLVIGTDGKAWYTQDHYMTFSSIE